jgi:hypothetical protein
MPCIQNESRSPWETLLPGIARGLQHQGRDGANEHSHGYSLGSVPPDVARHFSAARRVPDVNCVAEIELLDERREVVGISVHIIALPGLVGAPVSTAIVCNTPVASRPQKEHLIFEGVRTQRPAMAEDYWLT